MVRSLRYGDEVTAQNAGAMLGFYACHNEEHREAIAAQLETIIEPLARHLSSGKNGLVHNAALLLGQCLMFSTEFRQTFATDSRGPRALILALGDPDAGVLVNVTWAIRHFFSDERCKLSLQLVELAENSLPKLLAHQDARIKKHAAGLSMLVQQKKEALRRDNSMQAVKALTGMRDNDAFSALEALTSLAVVTQDLEECDDDEECSPNVSQQAPALNPHSPTRSPSKRDSPGQRRHSLIAPWKKVMANKLAIGVKSRNFHSAIVTQAAAG